MIGSFVLRDVIDPFRANEKRDWFIVDGLWSDAPPRTSALTLAEGAFIVAPLVDSHAHLTVEPGPDSGKIWIESVRTTADERRRRALDNLKKNAVSGVLAVRDAGAAYGELAAIDRSVPAGLPYLQSSGRIITGPGRQFDGVAHEVTGTDVARAASQEAERGGGWVKLVCDAPHRDRPGSPAETEWRLEDVRMAVAAARKHGARVIFHALTQDAARIGLEADVDTIEHGWGLVSDDLPELARRGIAWTPTARGLLDAHRAASAAGVRAPAFVEDGVERVQALIPKARPTGVRVLLGTDLAVSHGALVEELLTLVDLGMPPSDAVSAGTRDAWAFLGLPAIGTPGQPADFLVIDRDPIEDPRALLRPIVVVRAGGVVGDHRGMVT
jgi:imidazolonepropionase-like amidohydrolase